MRPAPPPGALATAEVVLDVGRGAAVALLHGVGVDVSSLEEVAEYLSTTHRVIIIRRPAGRSLDEQAAAVIASLAEVAPGPVTLAGVSGGATLALAAAISWPADVHAVVAHEPLLGPHADELHRIVTAGVAQLRDGTVGASAWFRGLVGDRTWQALPTGVDGRDIDVDDVSAFASWSPSVDDLMTLRSTRVVTTVGAWSSGARQGAANALADLVGARIVVLEQAGHLPQLECPRVFGDIVRAAATQTARSIDEGAP